VTILIATGMHREAKLMAAPGVTVVTGGGDSARLERALDAVVRGATLLISSGLAGALDPELAPGDLVLDGPADLVETLLLEFPEAYVGWVMGSDVPIGSVADKAKAAKQGAIAVDMESHVAERVAARNGVPFLVLRVISDGAEDALPPAALVAMKPDGGIALGAVLASLARHPAQLPALIRTGRDAEKGFRALRRLHARLHAGAGALDLARLALEGSERR